MKIKESTSGQNKINAELKKDVLNLNIKILNLNIKMLNLNKTVLNLNITVLNLKQLFSTEYCYIKTTIDIYVITYIYIRYNIYLHSGDKAFVS